MTELDAERHEEVASTEIVEDVNQQEAIQEGSTSASPESEISLEESMNLDATGELSDDVAVSAEPEEVETEGDDMDASDAEALDVEEEETPQPEDEPIEEDSPPVESVDVVGESVMEAEEVHTEAEADIPDPVLEIAEDQADFDTEPEEADPDAVAVVPRVEPDDDRAWFVVHCYSGYENKVRHNLEQRIDTMGMKNKIFDVVVPTEEEIEVKDGKRRTVERRVFPGYILVQMIMDEDSWYVVRNTPGVTGFVGMGNEPTPLRPEEVSQIVKRMEADAPRIKVTYTEGQKVRIIDGPFNDFIGTVSDIDMERAKVRVMVSFFGRETPVELDFLQVEKA